MGDNPYMKGANPFMPSSPTDAAQSVGADQDALRGMDEQDKGIGDLPTPDMNGYGVGESTKPRQIPGGSQGGADQMGVPQQPTGYGQPPAGVTAALSAFFAALKKEAISGYDAYTRARTVWQNYKGKKIEAPIGNNTTTWQDHAGNQHVRLHDTNVVSYSPGGGAVTFRNGGWPTATTHARIREHAPHGYYVSGLKSPMMVTPGGTYPFEDGMSFDTNTHERIGNNAVTEGAHTTPPYHQLKPPKKVPTKKAVPKPPAPAAGESFKDFLKRIGPKGKGAALMVQPRPVVPPHHQGHIAELEDLLLALAEAHAIEQGHYPGGWEPQDGGNVAQCHNCGAQIHVHHSGLGSLYGGAAVRQACPLSLHRPYTSPVASQISAMAAKAQESNPLLSEVEARRLARKAYALVKQAEDLNPLDFGVRPVPDGPLLGNNPHGGYSNRPGKTHMPLPRLPGGGAKAAPAADAAGVGEAAGAGGGAAAGEAAGAAAAAGEGAAAAGGLAELAPLLLLARQAGLTDSLGSVAKLAPMLALL